MGCGGEGGGAQQANLLDLVFTNEVEMVGGGDVSASRQEPPPVLHKPFSTRGVHTPIQNFKGFYTSNNNFKGYSHLQ